MTRRKPPLTGTIELAQELDEPTTAEITYAEKMLALADAVGEGGAAYVYRFDDKGKKMYLDRLTPDQLNPEYLADTWGGGTYIVQHVGPDGRYKTQVTVPIDAAVKPKAQATTPDAKGLGTEEYSLRLELARLQGKLEALVGNNGGGLNSLDAIAKIAEIVRGQGGQGSSVKDSLELLDTMMTVSEKLQPDPMMFLAMQGAGLVQAIAKEHPEAIQGFSKKLGLGGAADPARPRALPATGAPRSDAHSAPASAPAAPVAEPPMMGLARHAVAQMVARFRVHGRPETAVDMLIENAEASVPGPLFAQLVEYAADPQMVERAPAVLEEFFPELPSTPEWRTWVAQAVTYLHDAALEMKQDTPSEDATP